MVPGTLNSEEYQLIRCAYLESRSQGEFMMILPGNSIRLQVDNASEVGNCRSLTILIEILKYGTAKRNGGRGDLQ